MTDDSDIRDTFGFVKPEVESWLSEIEQAQRDMDQYDKRCRGIRDRYRYEAAKKNNKRKFQILWANIQILMPSIYARRPNPEVNSRFKTGDPVIRIASELLERNLDFQFDLGDYDHVLKEVRNSFLLYARGAARLVYDAEIENRDNGDPGPLSLDKDDHLGGAEGDPGSNPDASGPEDAGEPQEISRGGDESEVLKAENIRLEFVNREDLIHPKARRWRELPWLCFRSYLDRAALIKRFGEKIGSEIQLDSTGTDDQNQRQQDTTIGPTKDKATVFEIWDKTGNKVIWIAKTWPEILEEGPPYIKVQGFYPMPRPAYGTMTDDSLIPVPDFVFYQDQAAEIDELTARIGALVDALKLVGFYPAGPSGEGAPEIEIAMRPGFENRMVAVKSWAAFTSGGKNEAPIVWLPVEMVGEIIKGCVELRKALIDDVYQITGISDILRGDTEAEETAAAQGIKAQWGSVRLRDRQQEMARFARDVTRMAGEIISQQFSIDTLMRVASMPLPSDADVAKANAQYEQTLNEYKQLLALRSGQPVAGAGGSPAPPPGGPPESPPEPIRGPDKRIAGVKHGGKSYRVKRGPDGRVKELEAAE